MSTKLLFNLVWKHIKSRNHDHVLFSVYDPEETVCIHISDVSGLEPATLVEHPAVVLLPVARHDLGAARADLACFSLGKFVALVIEYGYLRARHRYSDGPILMVAIQRIAAKHW